MKKSIKIYLFEILVIITGVTLSLLIDEWRAKNEQEKEIKEYLSLIKVEVDFFFELTKDHVKGIDRNIEGLKLLLNDEIHSQDSILLVLIESEKFSVVAADNWHSLASSHKLDLMTSDKIRTSLLVTASSVAKQEKLFEEYQYLRRNQIYCLYSQYGVMNDLELIQNDSSAALINQVRKQNAIWLKGNYHDLIKNAKFKEVLEQVLYLHLDDRKLFSNTKETAGIVREGIEEYK